MPRVKSVRALQVGAQIIFVVAILGFLARVVILRWTQVVVFPWHFRIIPLIGSIALYIFAMLFWSTIWRYMAVQSGCPIKWADGVRVYMVSNLVKYVPGSIWGYVSRAYLGRHQGLTLRGVGLSVIWEVGITVVASLLLSLATLPVYLGRVPNVILCIVMAAALVSLIALLPPVFNNWIPLLKRFKFAEEPPAYRWRDFALYLSYAFASHVLVGTAFFMFAYSLVDLELHLWWAMVGMWSFSATAGLVTVLSPYGLGVKEGLLALFLQAFMPPGTATALSLASRLWIVADELLAASLTILSLRKFDEYRAK